MSAPINKKLPELTQAELTIVLKDAAYRGFNVNTLANVIAKDGVDKLGYNALTNQVYIVNDDGKLRNKVKFDRIIGADHSWSLTRFFKMTFCGCCFDQDKYDARIDTLATAIHQKIQVAEEQEKPSILLELASNQKIQVAEKQEQAATNLFGNKDLTLMKTILEKQADATMVPLYDKGADAPREIVWVEFNKVTQSIEIRSSDDRSKSLVFQLEPAVSYTVDGESKNLDEIPADRADWWMGSFKAAIELSSKYEFKNKKIEISALKRGVEKNPADHLNKLAEVLKTTTRNKEHPRLNVVLLRDDLSKGDGLDNGGISRDYLNSLFASLTENSGLFKSQKSSKLFMPVASQKGISSDNRNDLFPILTPTERRTFHEMGRAMMFCYKSKPNTEDIKNNSYAIGQHFDDLLFEIALHLNADQIDDNFEHLPIKTALARMIMEKFLRSDKTKDKDNQDDQRLIQNKLELFELFKWKEGDLLSNYNLAAADEYARKFNDEDAGFGLDMNAVNANPQGFVQAVLENLLLEKCGETTVGELIAPIHAVAQGLKSGCSKDALNTNATWNNIRHITPRDFNNKIQGSLDRDTIAAAFQIKTKILNDQGFEEDIPQNEIQELTKKTQWLMDWIKNPIVEDEAIRKFLVYATGSNSLPNGQKINIDRQTKTDKRPYWPVPHGITCSYTLLLSPEPSGHDELNDWTEIAFLKTLYEQILSDKSFDINID